MSEVSGTAKAGMHEQKLHMRHPWRSQGSTTYRRLVTYRNKPKRQRCRCRQIQRKACPEGEVLLWRVHLTKGDLCTTFVSKTEKSAEAIVVTG